MVKLSVLDIFAGAGGLSLGFHQTGNFKIKTAIEKNLSAATTYKLNHPETDVISEDIRKILFSDLSLSNDIQIVIGGPPCQGFSNANRQRNELISGNNQLVKEFVRAICEIQPEGFVMENVKTMGSSKHKFFATKVEKPNLQNKIYKQETIILGGIPEYNKTIISLYKNGLKSTLILNSELNAKLKSLIRYYKRHRSLKEFFIKNKRFFNEILSNWDRNFNDFNNCNFSKLVLKFKNALTISLDGFVFTPEIIEYVSKMVSINSILLMLKETIDKDILVTKIEETNKEICINVYTYSVIDYLEHEFDSLGYSIKHFILNASYFGVPQSRNRLFILGVKKGKGYSQPKQPSPLLNNNDLFTIEDAIKDLENLPVSTDINSDIVTKSKYRYLHPLTNYLNDETKYLYNHIVTDSSETALQRFKELKQGQNFHDLSVELKTTYTDTKRTQNTIYKRLDYKMISNTVVNVRKSMWIHPTKNRAISIREAARLQSFPDRYRFTGNKDSQYQQVGNAVPPLLARAVAEELLNSLGLTPNYPLADLITH